MSEVTNNAAASSEQTPLIFLDDIRVSFKTRTGSLLHPNKVQAVRGLTLKLMPGETIGIVGESGCGKSTTANVMCGLQSPTSGKVYFKGQDVTKRTADMRKTIGRVISVVFQDPATALNARMTVRDQLADPMIVHKVGDKASRATASLSRWSACRKACLTRCPARCPAASVSAWLSPVRLRSSPTPSSPTSPRPLLTCPCALRS